MFRKLMITSSALVLVTGVLIGHTYNSIQVPPGLENPHLYKSNALIVSACGSLARALAWLNQGEEAALFRSIVEFLINLDPKDKPPDNFQGLKTDRLINGVPVRIYQAKEKSSDMVPGFIFYHGGAYAFGHLSTYDTFIEKLVDKLGLVAVSVDYRRTPEHPFPAPTDDCYAVTTYIFDHPDEFSIDSDRIALAGDSAGGNVAAVITHKLQDEGRKQAKLQILVYPWMQLATIDLPSYQLYGRLGIVHEMGFSYGHFAKWYLNISASASDIIVAVKYHEHVKLLKDDKLKEKYLKYLDPGLISGEYINKDEEPYYKSYGEHIQRALASPPSSRGKFLAVDPKVRDTLLQVFDAKISPLLADSDLLAKLPKAHFAISEVDSLKDEGLIYAERLRRAGVSVNVKYYRTAYHGIFSALRPPFEFEIAHDMVQDILKFIAEHI